VSKDFTFSVIIGKKEKKNYCIANIGHLKDLIPIAVVKVRVTENNIDIGLVLRKPWYLNIRVCCTVLVELLLKNNSVVDIFFRMTNPVNKAVFVRVVEAIHHDYGGKEQCPWTSAQLKSILYSVLQCIVGSLVILLCTLGMDVEKHNLD